VEGLEENGGVGDFFGISGGEVGLRELSGEGGIAGVPVESRLEEFFGLCGAVVGEEETSKGGGGRSVGGGSGECEIAAVGFFGGRDVVGGSGYFGGGEDVAGLLGGEVEGGEKFGGGGGGVGRCGKLVDASESSECARFERGRSVRKSSDGEEVGAGFGVAIGAGEQKAERDMRGGEERVSVDGFAVIGLGGRSTGVGRSGRAEGLDGHAEVVEDLRIVGDFGVEVGEEFEGGGIVSGGEGVVGFLDEWSGRGGFGVGVREILCREGEGERNDRQDGGEGGREEPRGFERVGRGACDEESPSWLTKITRLTEKPGAGLHCRRWG
jgi:hypothetical protein